MNFNKITSFLNCVQTQWIPRNSKGRMVAVHYTHNQTFTEIRMLEINVDFSIVDPLLIQEC